MRKYLLSLLFLCGLIANAHAAADLGNTAVISPTDASNGSGTCPSWLGSAAPSTIDDAGRCLQGAIAREWQNRSLAVTSTGSADAYVVAYTVAPAALRSGQVYSFITNFANTGTATVNINSLGAKTIKKDVAGTLTALASGDMGSGQFVMLAYNGTDMIWVNWQGTGSTAATTTEQLTGTSTSVVSNPDTVAALWEKGSNIASAGTISIGEGGYFHVTGTTTITDIDFATATNGRCVWLIFDGALILTHNATTLLVPGGASKTTAANDRAKVCQDSGDNVIITAYEPTAGSGADYQTFTTSGTWTKPSSGTRCTIEAWGGGGSGGAGVAGAAQGGGGGGAYNELTILMSSLGATETVTIGAGGAAQTVDSTAGNVGGDTTFGAHLTAYGGGAGGTLAGGGGAGGGSGGLAGAGGNAAGGTGGAGGIGFGTATPSFVGFGLAGGATGANGSSAVASTVGFVGGSAGGAASEATSANGDGGASVRGGAGGGAGAEDAAPGPGVGGFSVTGGNGGAGAFDASNATAGSAPAGGGGGSEAGDSGAGARGEVRVTCH